MTQKKLRIVAIVQARMGSNRLPGKVMREIGGRTMLEWVVERTRQAETVDEVVVATTNDVADNKLASLCERKAYPYYRGSQNDVLDRYYQTARRYRADVIVRITADCPLIDPAVVDNIVLILITGRTFDDVPSSVGLLRRVHYDFAANRLPQPWGRTYPIGLDTEAFTYASLERAWKEANQTHQREHVTPYFYEDLPPDSLQLTIHHSRLAERHIQFVSSITPRGFRVALLHHHPDYGHMRWTVDTEEDLNLVREIVARIPGRDDFTWLDILELFEREPNLAQINAQVPHKDHLNTDDD